MRVLEARGRLRSDAPRRLRRRAFARRVFGAGRGAAPSRSPMRRACSSGAARRCSRPCRSARARWRRCSASSSTRRARSPPRRRQGEVCAVANDNAPGQVVVSGHKAAVERAIAIAARARRQALDHAAGQRALPLRADGAGRRRDGGGAGRGRRSRRRRCRSSPMSPRRRSATRSRSARLLVEQVTGMVRWRESVLRMKEQGVEELVEIGAGRVLTGLAKRIDRDLATASRRHAGRDRSLPQDALGRRAVMFDLTGKSALVTGASGGIGGAIATRAARARAPTVVLAGTRARRRSRRWPASSASALIVAAADLADPASAPTRWSRRPRRRWASVDILVNNAGHHPRHARAAHEGRGLADGARRQSDRRLPPRARRAARHDAAALRAASSASPRWSASPAIPARPITPPPRPA